ncbi:MAG TPA: hypothetical protein VIY52_05095 [Streptosporangiaceae bacterium]
MGDLTRAESRAETEEWLRHGSSFGAAAAAYAEHRPGYAEAAVRWVLEPLSANSIRANSIRANSIRASSIRAGPVRVLDLGGPETSDGEFVLPMATVVLRARRK